MGLSLALIAGPLSLAARADTVSTASSNFNATGMTVGDYIWFNSVLNIGAGAPASTFTVNITSGSIAIHDNSGIYNVTLPKAQITFDTSAVSASTTFNAATQTWQTIVPHDYSGNVWMDGAAYAIPTNLAQSNPVEWTSSFTLTSTANVTFNWQWAAAVYPHDHFSTDYNALGVKPVDSNNLSIYSNSDHAGTPEGGGTDPYKSYVAGGATGGQGSNYTGSYSETKSVSLTPTAVPLPGIVPMALALFGGIAGFGWLRKAQAKTSVEI